MASLMLSINPSCSGRYELLKMSANSLYHLKQYRRAMRYFEDCLSSLLALSQGNGKSIGADSFTLGEEGTQFNIDEEWVDTRFKMAKCCFIVKDLNLAKNSLRGIPHNNRSAEVWQLLGKVCEAQSNFREAYECYLRALDDGQFSLEVYADLLRVHSAGKDMPPVQLPPLELSPLISILKKVKELQYMYKYDQAISLLKQLEGTSSPLVLKELAYCYYCLCEYDIALRYFERSYELEPECLKYMDIYASILRGKTDILGLNKLANELLSVDQTAPQPWTVLAKYVDAKGEKDRALMFVNQALNLNSLDVDPQALHEAYMMKGRIMLSNRKPNDALVNFKKAHMIQKNVFTFEGCLECLIMMGKGKEALIVAKEAITVMKDIPKCLVFTGYALKENDESEKAKRAFETALAKNPDNVDATIALCELLCEKTQYREAIRLLQNQLSHFSTDWLHTKLGDLFLLQHRKSGQRDPSNESLKAFYHYHFALALNPNFQDATDGLARCEAVLNGGDADQMEADEDGGFNEGEEFGDDDDL